MSVYDTIAAAIRAKQNLSFTYKEHFREYSPHELGESKGHLNVFGLQYGGESSSGPVTGETKQDWRCFTLELVENLKVIGGEWRTHETYKVPPSCIEFTHVKVAAPE